MNSVKIADHMPLIYTPSFWDPAKTYQKYEPDIEGAKLEGAEYARKHGLEPAFKLLERPEGASMAFLTDLQHDFRPNGTNDGSPVDAGYIQPVYDPRGCVAYNKYLESTGQAPQWAFAQHCELGTDGESFHPLIVEVVAFASGLRSFVPGLVSKGHIMEWDWYGPLCSCGGYSEDPNIVPVITHPQGGFQKDIVDGFKPYRTVEYFGVAEDFCDYWMKRMAMWYFKGTDFLKKMVFVEDGTAPIVPNAKHVIEQNKKARAEGVKFIKHDTPFVQSL
ncbi:MAG: hypothetical protein G01um101470_348 [Parcubacteria group bacterium Gr01-1014_70]|nr:MAG: hypothetical protein G01um101470_348 [Parcubacteria group bacterium Gr01-1014_70]